MKTRHILGGALLATLIIVISTSGTAMAKSTDKKICDGVFAGGLALGGMTKSEATQEIDQYVEKLENRRLDVKVEGTTVTTTLEELGFENQKSDVVEQALNIGEEGDILTRYMELKDVENERFVFDLKFTVDKNKVASFITYQCSQYSHTAKNAGIKRKNRQFIYTKEKAGRKVDIKETIAKVSAAIVESTAENVVTVDAIVIDDLPAVDKATASLCKDKLGSFSTVYNSGFVNRSRNLANAASLIDGTVVYPGETFSVYNTISPLTEENGYFGAPSYSNGEVVESIGGGVCQVSTTLYNAVLLAEQDIVERSPHSMMVSYVEPSQDAAIAGTYKDFKFKNTTDAPLYLMGGAHDGTIYFTVYGHETRAADRQVKYKAEIIETIEPGKDKITKDPTKPKSYMLVTQVAHTGYKAELWKIVTENGEETKTLMNTSSYAAAPRFVTKGTAKVKKVDKKVTATATPKTTAKPKATTKPATN